MQYVAPLTEGEIQTFQERHRYHPSRRARMRAHRLLLSHQGVAMAPIARRYQVDYRSVSSWINPWQTRGFVGLEDPPGAGRRPTLSLDEQQTLQPDVPDSPTGLKKVVHHLEQEPGQRVRPQTITRLMKKNRSVWKRRRKAPATSPDPHTDERSKGFMKPRHQREALGEGDLWYGDGTGFGFTPGIPYAGQPRGHPLAIPASRPSQRVNVRGFLNRSNELVPDMIDGNVEAPVIVTWFDHLSQPITQKTEVCIDNAPRHRSHALIKPIPTWVQKG